MRGPFIRAGIRAAIRVSIVTGLVITFVLAGKGGYSQSVAYFEWVHQGDSLLNKQAYTAAAHFYTQALAVAGSKIHVQDWYNATRAYARGGNTDSAFLCLGRLLQASRFTGIPSLKEDSDLIGLRKDGRWKPLLEVAIQKDKQMERHINVALRSELWAIFDSDQRSRLQLDSVIRHYGINSPQVETLEEAMAAADEKNLDQVQRILNRYGWVGIGTVGEKASTALFIVIQHADERPDLQRKYLPLLRKAVAAGEASPENLAYLEDRLRVTENRRQLYGTQLKRNESGLYLPFPIEDSLRVDTRRAAVGLAPLRYYLWENNGGK